jgi:hypothetical protein
MKRDWMTYFDINRYRWWGVIPLFTLVWHGLYTAFYLEPDYLLFVCYPANLLLGIGIFMRSGLLTGTGFGWALAGMPLWLYDAIRMSDWEISGVLFHVCGSLVGLLTLKYHRYPKHTWTFAVGLALVLQILSRLFTKESLNVNAAFRVYEGWETVFPNYMVYFITMTLGFCLIFIALTLLNRKMAKRIRG